MKSVTATVIELLPQATYRLQLADRRLVLAHTAGAGQIDFVRVRPGDKVKVELSPHDPTRGRIIGTANRSDTETRSESAGPRLDLTEPRP